MISVYEMLGIPLAVSVGFVTVALIVMLSPYLEGKDIGVFKFPALNLKAKRVFIYFGPLLFLVSLGSFYQWIEDPRQSGRSADAFGLRVNSVQWEHRFKVKGPNKDFEGTITYDVECTSPYRVGELLADDAVWFGHGIVYLVHGKVVKPADQPYTLLVTKVDREETAQKFDEKVTHIFWQPSVTPPLKHRDTLKYQVTIETENTEAKAFTKEGSFAGMRTRYPASKLSMRVHAPSGMKFELRGHFARDTSGENIDLVAKDSEPELDSNGQVITWTVTDPFPTVTYLVKLAITDQ